MNMTTFSTYKYPLIVSAILLSLCSLTACAKQKNADVANTTTKTGTSNNNKQAEDQPTRAKNYLLLDVRSQVEYSRDGLKEAISIPYKDIENKINSITGGNKNIPIKVHCRSGNRAGVAIQTLQKMGYSNVENLRTLAGAITYLENNPIYNN